MKKEHPESGERRRPEDGTDFVKIGVLGKPHGLRGAMFLVRDDGDDHWPGHQEVLLRGESAPRAVRRFYVSGGRLVLEIEGIGSREAADALVGSELSVDAARIELDDGEELVRDLVGCAVHDEGGARIGVVVAVHSFGAQDTLEMDKEGGGKAYLPFLDGFVTKVDSPGRRIDVSGVSAFLDSEGGG